MSWSSTLAYPAAAGRCEQHSADACFSMTFLKILSAVDGICEHVQQDEVQRDSERTSAIPSAGARFVYVRPTAAPKRYAMVTLAMVPIQGRS